MSVHVAKQRQKLILEHLKRLKRELALHPDVAVRVEGLPKVREIERLLEP